MLVSNEKDKGIEALAETIIHIGSIASDDRANLYWEKMNHESTKSDLLKEKEQTKKLCATNERVNDKANVFYKLYREAEQKRSDLRGSVVLEQQKMNDLKKYLQKNKKPNAMEKAAIAALEKINVSINELIARTAPVADSTDGCDIPSNSIKTPFAKAE